MERPQGEGTDDPQAERGERTRCHALTPAQGLERGRDGGGKGHDGHTGMIYNRAQGEVRKPKCQRTEG
jgi:hypothetical protein